MQGWKAVLVTVAATALLVGQASGAQAADRSAGAVVQQSVGGDHRVHEVTGAVDLAGVTITAPRDRRAYATEDAVIAALTEGQTTASFGLPAAGELQADGSVVLASEASPGVRLTAEIAPPWAKDAHGRSLPTWYALDSSGRVLTQHVDTEGATYPIAADPRLTFGWGVYLNVTGAEAKAIATALIAAGGTAAIVACSGLGKLPLIVGRVVQLLCTVVGVPTIRAILNSIVSLWRAGGSTSNSTCYQRRIVGPSTGWYKVALSNCVG
jgi:hypothetical protein